MFAYVNHARIRSWNQPVLSKEGKVSCSRKERGPLLGLELTTDRHPRTTSQTRYPLRHAALPVIVTYPYTRLYSFFVVSKKWRTMKSTGYRLWKVLNFFFSKIIQVRSLFLITSYVYLVMERAIINYYANTVLCTWLN